MATQITYSSHVYAPTCRVTATFADADELLPTSLPGPFVFRIAQPSDPVSDALYRVAVLTDFAGVSTSRAAALRGDRGLSGVSTISATSDLASGLFYFSNVVTLTANSIPELKDKCAALEQRVENLINAYAAYVQADATLTTTKFPLYNTALVTAAKDKYYAAVAAETTATEAVAAAADAVKAAQAQYDAATTLVTSLGIIKAAVQTMQSTTSTPLLDYSALYTAGNAQSSPTSQLTNALAAANGDWSAIATAEGTVFTTVSSQLTAAESAQSQKKTALAQATQAAAAATLAQTNATVAAATALAELKVVCPVFTA